MKKAVLFIFALSTYSYMEAQTIKGQLVDQVDSPIEYATIVLQTVDSIDIDATYSDSLGHFSFHSHLESFRLNIQHLLFETFEDKYAASAIGKIRLEAKSHALSEVVVKGKRPLVQLIEGKMTYDMSLLTEGKVISNAYESLLQLPGVHEQNEMITLAGAPSLAILLNGKPTTMTYSQLMELLKNTPKERVQKAEVMYAAPPQYHVRGAAINIVMSVGESEAPSLQGQINGGYIQGHYANYQGGLTMLYTTPKASIDLMYAYGSNKVWSGIDLHSNHSLQGKKQLIEQFNRGFSQRRSHFARLGSDFKLNQSNKLSMVYTTQIVPELLSYEASKGTFSQSLNRKKLMGSRPEQMHNIQANYTSGFGLTAGGDYTYYKSHTTQSYQETMPGKEDAFEADGKQDISRLTIYADQKLSLGKDWGLNFGGKFMFASDKSSQRYRSLTGKDMADSNSDSRLDEYTYDFYIGFNKAFSEKFSLLASLTGEYYSYNDFDEWSVFPTVSLTYMPQPTHIFQLTASSNKTYPSYWELMDAVSYMNGYAELHGNPYLRPFKDYSFQLNYILKGKYVIGAYTVYQDDCFEQLPYQSPDRLALIYKTTNYNYAVMTGINAVLPFRVGKVWDARLTLNGYYKKIKSDHFHGTSFLNDNWAFYADLSNTFTLSSKPDIKAELSAMYHSKPIQGPSTLKAVYKIDAGVKWTFLQGNGELRLKGYDLFDSGIPKEMRIKYGTQDLRMPIHSDGRNISLSFTYKFGGYKEKKRQEVDTSRFGK